MRTYLLWNAVLTTVFCGTTIATGGKTDPAAPATPRATAAAPADNIGTATLLKHDKNQAIVAMTSDGTVLLGKRFDREDDQDNGMSFVYVVDADRMIDVELPKEHPANVRGVILRDMADTLECVGAFRQDDHHYPDLAAVIWNEKAGCTVLPMAKDAVTSGATAISKDGMVIGGHCDGMPCVWHREPDGSWAVRKLACGPSYEGKHTRLIGLSPSGRYAVGSTPTSITWASTKGCTWDLTTGAFRVIPGNETGIARCVNDHGVAAMSSGNYAMLWEIPTAKAIALESNGIGEASCINNDGVVAGWSHFPPRPCEWVDGKIRMIGEENATGRIFCMSATQQGGFFVPLSATSYHAMVRPIAK